MQNKFTKLTIHLHNHQKNVSVHKVSGRKLLIRSPRGAIRMGHMQRRNLRAYNFCGLRCTLPLYFSNNKLKYLNKIYPNYKPYSPMCSSSISLKLDMMLKGFRAFSSDLQVYFPCYNVCTSRVSVCIPHVSVYMHPLFFFLHFSSNENSLKIHFEWFV